jgi:predicted RNA-binding Zn-ribbon protein involved in translation (DUF1610 family)
MSKPLTLIGKIKLFILYMKNKDDNVVVNCPYCGSTNIKFNHQNEIVSKDGSKTYSSYYTCNECNAGCFNTQYWSK